MPLEDLAQQKRRFLEKFGSPSDLPAARAAALHDAVVSAVLHNALYSPSAKASDRQDVGAEWKSVLESLASEYVEPATAEKYEQDLVRLQAHMNRGFGHVFRQARHPKFGYEPGFRVSHAQMSLSLMLKHCWCLDLAAMPPECPVDRPVLIVARAGELNAKWTDVNSLEAHRAKIKWLAEAASRENLALAEWELKTVNGG